MSAFAPVPTSDQVWLPAGPHQVGQICKEARQLLKKGDASCRGGKRPSMRARLDAAAWALKERAFQQRLERAASNPAQASAKSPPRAPPPKAQPPRQNSATPVAGSLLHTLPDWAARPEARRQPGEARERRGQPGAVGRMAWPMPRGASRRRGRAAVRPGRPLKNSEPESLNCKFSISFFFNFKFRIPILA